MTVTIYSAVITIDHHIKGHVFDFNRIGSGSGQFADSNWIDKSYVINSEAQPISVDIPGGDQPTDAFEVMRSVWRREAGYRVME
jgi:hypothetical protein